MMLQSHKIQVKVSLMITTTWHCTASENVAFPSQADRTFHNSGRFSFRDAFSGNRDKFPISFGGNHLAHFLLTNLGNNTAKDRTNILYLYSSRPFNHLAARPFPNYWYITLFTQLWKSNSCFSTNSKGENYSWDVMACYNEKTADFQHWILLQDQKHWFWIHSIPSGKTIKTLFEILVPCHNCVFTVKLLLTYISL